MYIIAERRERSEANNRVLFEIPRYLYVYIYRTSQNFRDRKISRIASKKGGQKYSRQNIREGGSDTLRNTITWLLFVWLVGSLAVDESFSVLFTVACL